jgi:hypothetical protein
MVNIKEMSYREKYAKALDSLIIHETFISSFIQEHLEDQALNELKGI